MSGRQRRRSRGLASTLVLVAWILAAASLANPSPAAAVVLVFVAGLVTGGALVYHANPDQRRPASPPTRARRAAAGTADTPRVSAPGPAAPARPRSAPQPGPGGLHVVPPVGPNHPDAAAALRATLAARADQVSSYVPKPPDPPEPSR